MANFKRYDVAGLLGFTPIARVTDAEIWALLLTPHVRALLGDVVSVAGPVVSDSVHGFFPGDDVTNLNGHRLYGGLTSDHVRFPYVNVMYRTRYGALVIKRDLLKIKAMAWFGDVERGKAQLIYSSALRDRRFDGTRRANDISLIDFPYDERLFNAPLPFGTSCEQSIYGFLPGSRITEILGPEGEEYEKFVGNPFTFLDRPEVFLKYFQRAWNGGRSPGQIGAVIPDVSKLIIQQFEKVAAKCGYDFIENCSSHYHVARWTLSLGYRYTYEHDAVVLRALTEGINRLKASGRQFTRPQESWICVVQSLRPIELIPEGLYLGGPEWPQNNIDQKNLWMNKPLNEKAAALLPKPLVVDKAA